MIQFPFFNPGVFRPFFNCQKYRAIHPFVGGDKPTPIPKLDATGKQTGFWRAEDVSHTDAYSQARGDREGLTQTASGTEHLSSLRGSYLQDLANQTGLVYRRLDNVKSFSRQIRSKPLGIPKVMTTDIRWLFALACLGALVATLSSRLMNALGMRSRARGTP
jgi:mxaL protein